VYGTVEAYTPATDTWTTLQPMPTRRLGTAAVAGADGRIYVLGGLVSNTGILSTVEAYSPDADTWTTVQPMLSTRHGHAAASGPDERFYVFGGTVHASAAALTDIVDAVETYVVNIDGWRTVEHLLAPRAWHAAVTGSDGWIYVIGGFLTGLGYLAAVDGYHPASDGWHTFKALPVPRGSLAAVAGPDGRVYAIGGATGGAGFTLTPAVDVFDPAA
jgi:N-acetylneuraminic acid mutarotase